MPKLFTVVFPAYNEENRIENVIKNYLQYTDDIIVIDKYSSDKTIEICNKYNAKVIFYPSGIDDTEQILMANKIAKYDWVLYTICSELAPIELLNEFAKIVGISKQENIKAAVFNRISYTGGVVTHNLKNYYKNFKNGIFARFINKNFYDSKNSRIHFEIPVIASEKEIYIVDSKISMKHFRDDDISSSEQKHSRYADIEANSMINMGVKGTLFRLFGRTIYNFFKIYRMNFKSGFPGFIVSILHAQYVFQVELRLLSHKYNFNKNLIIKKNKEIKNNMYRRLFNTQ